MDLEKYVREATNRWGDRFDYSKVEYVNMKSKISLRCKIHDYEFDQVAGEHLKGRVSCRGCRGYILNTEDFISRSREVHGDRWDYSSTTYSGKKSISIACREHGEFTTIPINHLRGHGGCPRCGDRRKISVAEFVSRAKKQWGDQFDYSKTDFSITSDEATIICRKHGEFVQTPRMHLKGVQGCPMCSRRTEENFNSRMVDIWGDRWDLSDMKYDGMNSTVTIRCPEHGKFTQSADKAVRGFIGCPSCGVQTSGGELELEEFINSLGMEVNRRRRDLLIGNYEIDFFFPDAMVGVEFNGVYYHSDKFKNHRYHYDKFKMANDNGIKLIQVWEDDWNLRKDIVKEHLKMVLGVSDRNRIGARSLTLRQIQFSEASDFLNTYHIQGSVGATYYIGGFFRDQLVLVASFLKGDNQVTLSRYATSSNVVGGHSKVMKFFRDTICALPVITFADLSFGDGNLYRVTGWEEDAIIPPDYMYLRNGVRHHKFNYRKARFKKDDSLKFVDGLTERELAKLNNLHRVYDAGKIRFIWR